KDNVSVAKVDVYLKSGTTQKLVASKTAAPYTGTLDTTGLPSGSATMMAVATDAAGLTSSTQRSVTIDNGSTTPAPAPSPVASADIIMRASADAPFSQHSGYVATLINTYTQAPQVPESGIHGTTLPNGETLRFGKVSDPTNAVRKALAFTVRNSDPTTSNGKRTELSLTPNIEMNKVYWIAFSAYIEDWGTLATNDNALFGTQLHQGNKSLVVGGPAFGLYTTQTGRTFRVQARYSESATPSSSNAVSVKHAEYPIPFQRWTDFVVKFKQNTSGNGFLQVWMDGQMIADYKGSLGYNTGYTDYAKFGYYNWTASAMSSTPRKVLLREPTIVADPTGTKYSLAQLRAHLGSSTTSSASGTTTLGSGDGSTSTSGGLCSTALCVATQ
ncbi:MAG TPA: heparin lyase I family protein, partial [Burkholderiales bacterium]|nr:heparin lyase I family protein [Burkholderiales bacterium]